MVSTLFAVITATAGGAAEPSPFTSTFVARWNLTHGKYLIDIGEYLEALEAFDTAIEMADVVEVRTEAQLQKAVVLALFLDAPEESVAVYDAILRRDPDSSAAESALMRAGMVLFDGGQHTRAAGYFERYQERYPDGASRATADLLARQSRARADTVATAAPPPTTEPSPAAPPPTAEPPTLVPPTATAEPPTPAPTPTATHPLPAPTRQLPTASARPTAKPSLTPPPTETLTARPISPMPPATVARPRATVIPAPPGASIADVRVRVFRGRAALRVEADGGLTLTPPLASGSTVELTAKERQVSVNGQKGVPEVTLRAERPLALKAGGTTRHYRGAVHVHADGGTLLIVNRVGIEEYLYGVVTKESVQTWPLEALKAQAIASRTYALYQVRHRRDRSWDMVDDEGSQVYGGVEGESAPGRRAVDETRGVVVVYRGRPIYAMFTSNTGWHTGDPKFIFDQPLAYLQAVPDPYSPGEQLGRWSRGYTAAHVRRALGDIGVHLGPIRAIEARVTCPSGRIVRVAIEDDRGTHVMRTRPTLGRALKLPEILLNIRREGDKFVFAGGGFGHGVGLSQWGAKNMASKGIAVDSILAFYYRGTELTTLTSP